MPRAQTQTPQQRSVFVLVFPASQFFTALLLLLLLTLLLRFSFILKSRVISCISLELSVTKRNRLIKNRTLTKNEEKKVVGEISVKHVTDASAERSGVTGAKCNKKSTTKGTSEFSELYSTPADHLGRGWQRSCDRA